MKLPRAIWHPENGSVAQIIFSVNFDIQHCIFIPLAELFPPAVLDVICVMSTTAELLVEFNNNGNITR